MKDSTVTIIPNININLCVAEHAGEGEVLYTPVIGWVIQVIQKPSEDCPSASIAFPFTRESYTLDHEVFLFDRATDDWSMPAYSFGNGEESFIKSYDAWKESQRTK